MKGIVELHYTDRDGNDGVIRLDGDICTPILSITNGILTVQTLNGIDFVTRFKETQDEISKIRQFENELDALQHIAEDNYQKEMAGGSGYSDWRYANSSGYLAAIKDIYAKFIKIFKEIKNE